MKSIAVRLLILVAISVTLAGCNDSEDNDTTVEEAPVYQRGTNGNPVIVVSDNDGLVVVDLTTGETVPYDIYVQNNGSNGVVAITVETFVPPEVPEIP